MTTGFDEFDPMAGYDPFANPVSENSSIAEGTAPIVRIIPAPGNPVAVVEEYLRHHREPLRYWRQEWYIRNGCYWVKIPENQLNSALNTWLSHSFFKKDNIPLQWNPTIKKRAEVLAALRLHHDVMLSDLVAEASEGTPFRNGVLIIDKVGDTQLVAHDAGAMRTWCVDAEYSTDALCPEWEAWLAESLDPDQVLLAQEWAGYVLSGDTRAQKVMLAYGASRAGKSTYASVLAALMGTGAAATTPAEMLSPFGMEPLINARLVTMGDVQWSEKTARKMLDKVRAISGGDGQPVNRKFKAVLKNAVLPCRFMFTSNPLPVFADDSGATLARFLLLAFVHGHEGHEDHTLLGRLLAELPGIAQWALQGYKRLVSNGLKFTDPLRSRADRCDLRLDVEPVRTFCGEMIVYDESAWSSVVDLFDAFNEWQGHDRGDDASRTWFGRKLKAALPAARGERQYVTRDKDKFDSNQGTKRVRERGFSGIRLRTADDDAPPVQGIPRQPQAALFE